MRRPPRVEAKELREAKSLLEAYTGGTATEPSGDALPGASDMGVDAVIVIPPYRFGLELKKVGSPAQVSSAIQQLRRWSDTGSHVNSPSRRRRARAEPLIDVPIVVVPFMGAAGRELCAEAGTNWIDLAGNAHVTASRLRLWIDGLRNPAPQRPEATNPFAPRASRLVHALLLDPERAWTQQALAAYTGLDKGFVSKLTRALEAQQLLTSTRGAADLATAGIVPDGAHAGVGRRAYRVTDPAALLAAWRGAYDFQKHDIHKGVIAARSGAELLQRLVRLWGGTARPVGRIAATGLAAAGQLAPYADFRTVTLYCQALPPADALEAVGFRPETRGSNVWLVVPNDAGVFLGAEDVRGVPCVSAVQTYLDLFFQPERAPDAAAELRRQLLPWSFVGSGDRSVEPDRHSADGTPAAHEP